MSLSKKKTDGQSFPSKNCFLWLVTFSVFFAIYAGFVTASLIVPSMREYLSMEFYFGFLIWPIPPTVMSWLAAYLILIKKKSFERSHGIVAVSWAIFLFICSLYFFSGLFTI